MRPINSQPNSKGKCLGAPDAKTALNDWTGTFLLDFVSESLKTHPKYHFTHNKSVFIQLLWYTLVMLSPMSWQFWCFFFFFSYTNLFGNTHSTALAKVKENDPLLFVQSSCNSYYCNVVAVWVVLFCVRIPDRLSLADWPINWNSYKIYVLLLRHEWHLFLFEHIGSKSVYFSIPQQHLYLGA